MSVFSRGLSVAAMLFFAIPATAQEATIRSSAVVDLSFDEVDGPSDDRAAAGAAKDNAQPINVPERVTSPFWNAQSGRAIKLDATKTQFFQIADSADLDHQAGTTLSFYFLNLHEPTDRTFRGIVAKRDGTKFTTNYGLNFQPASKKLQVYIHDGSGFKVVGFPIEQSFGTRRLVHLTATFRPSDAPGVDDDEDADDLEIRLHVNGRPIKPQDATGGFVVENAGWIRDVNFAGLLNDTPLTIGASFPNGEPISGLFDEFLLFNRALSIEEAAKLFVEVAGPDGEKLAKIETEGVPSSTPVVANVVPRGLQIGATTRLTISGQNLGPGATLSLLGTNVEHAILPNSTPEQLRVDVTVPSDHVPTVVPLVVCTETGVSTAVALPIDRLPQKTIGKGPTTDPAVMPAAYTGTLNGADRRQLIIEGKAGQVFIADVELKRLGGGSDPVLELKTESQTPIEIAWGRAENGGDARLIATLPADGRYVLELHDLAFKAPRSPFRLLVGDLKLIDAVLPAAVEAGSARSGIAIGPGIGRQPIEIAAESVATSLLSGPAMLAAQGPLPSVHVSDGRELTEEDASKDGIDLAASGTAPTYLTGQLTKKGEVDRIRVRVLPQQALDVRVEAKTLGSSVEPTVVVREQNRVLGRKASQPGSGEASLSVTPQTAEIEIRINDRFRGEGLYRLRMAPAGTPELRVTMLDSSILLPRSGRGVARLRIERRGKIGTVKLIPNKSSGVVLEPSSIPAGRETEEVFITVGAAPNATIGESFSITAEAETPGGVLTRAVEMSLGTTVASYDPRRAYFEVPIIEMAAAPSIELVRVPKSIFKGVADTIGVQVVGDLPNDYAVRFSIVTDESTRPVDPRNAAAGNKPLVRLGLDAAVPPGMREAVLPLLCPNDVEATTIKGVIKAEVVPHAWSNQVAAIGYSAPVSFAVEEAIASIEATGSTALKVGENTVPIAVKRHDGFAQPVGVELRGLPEGFAAPAVDLPRESAEAKLVVTVSESAKEGAVQNLELVVVATDGTVLKSQKPFALEVQP